MPSTDKVATSSGRGGSSEAKADSCEPRTPDAKQEAGIIVGRLVSERDFPVPWALISLAPLDREGPDAPTYSFVSGRDGTFIAGAIEPGRYRVIVSHIGYKPTKPFVLVVTPGQRVVFDVVLKEQLFEVPSIIVTAQRK